MNVKQENLKLSDFQKLLIAQSYVKMLKKEIEELKIENGIKQSEIDELIYRVRKMEKSGVSKDEFIEITQSEIIRRYTEDYKRAIEKRDNKLKEKNIGISQLKKQLEETKKELSTVRKINSSLIGKITLSEINY